MNEQNFLEMYAARFRALGSGDGLGEWVPTIQESNASIMADALDAIAAGNNQAKQRGDIVGAPKLVDVKLAYARAAAQARERAREAYASGGAACQHCGGSGWAYSVKSYGGTYFEPGKPIPNIVERWSVGFVPCHCAAGAATSDSKGNPYPAELRNRLRRYHIRSVDDQPTHLGAARIIWQDCTEVSEALACDREAKAA